MDGIEIEAIEQESKSNRPLHRGFNIWVNGRIVRAVQYAGEAQGLVAAMKAERLAKQREASLPSPGP